MTNGRDEQLIVLWSHGCDIKHGCGVVTSHSGTTMQFSRMKDNHYPYVEYPLSGTLLGFT